jgi:PAS domain S-box-containing protein
MQSESTVFVVDDDDAVRESIVILLEAEGFQVADFSSSEAFLKAYQPDSPGCLVLDVSMPGMNGLELQQALVQRQHSIPIIFITGHGDVPMSVKALRAGAIDFIEKPFNDDILISRIRDALALDLQFREVEARRLANAIHNYAESMVETVREPLVVLDENLHVLTANRSFYQTFKIPPPGLDASGTTDVNRRIETVLWTIPQLKDHIEAVVANKSEMRDLEIEHEIANIGYKVMRFNACELWQPSLQPRRFLLTMEDITQRKRSEQQAQALLQSAPDAIVVVDENGIIKIVNQRTESLFGYQSHELIDQPLEMLIPQQLHQQHIQNRKNYFLHPRTQVMSFVKDIYAVRKDGTEVPVDVSLSPFESSQGLLVVGAVRDVSEHKYIEAELRRHRDHLEELVAQRTADLQASNKELESYSYSIAHDLRAPLRAITSFSQILKEDTKDKLTADDLEHLNRVIVAGIKMAHLIDDILELARITRKEIRFSQVNLSHICNEILARLKHSHPDRKVQCQVQENLLVSGDARLLECALQNLVENAWKFTRDKASATIEIGAIEKGGVMHYYVKDNGIGFDTQYSEKLFQPFHRLHSAEDYEGTGVGLATVRRIIQRHGGRVWAESQKQQGATFYFTLPLKSPGISSA